MQKHKRIIISPLCYVAVAVGLLIMPVRWLVAWFFAVAVHELSHYLMMLLLRVPIYQIRISIDGMVIDAGDMSTWTEFVCTLAGPAGALLLLFFARYLPYTAVCVLIQSIFNLLPIYPFDGGRLLKCLTEKAFGIDCAVKVQSTVKYIMFGIMVVISFWITVCLDFGILPLSICVLLIIRSNMLKRPCKLPMQYSTIKQIKQDL